MGHRIRLSNSRRTFEAEEQETILEAALRSGVRLPYNCTNGTCGECKARIEEGRVSRVDFHDYALTEAEKSQNYVLLCSAHAGGDLTIAVDEAESSDDIPRQELTTRLWRQEQVGDAFRVLHLRTPRTRTLRFLAGQHVMLQLPNGETAAKAVASCPCNGRFLQFHLHRDGEAFDRVAWQQLQVGDPVMLAGPDGGFTLDEEAERPMVLVAEGTGFAPVKSIIEQAIAIEMSQPVRLFRVSADADGFYLSNYCRSWADALDDYVYTPVTEGGKSGVFKRVLDGLGNPKAFDAYIAAGASLTRSLVDGFLAAGVPPERIRVYPDGRPPSGTGAGRTDRAGL